MLLSLSSPVPRRQRLTERFLPRGNAEERSSTAVAEAEREEAARLRKQEEERRKKVEREAREREEKVRRHRTA